MKNIQTVFTVLIAVFTISTINAQYTIKGKVLTADSTPTSNINVSILDSKKRTVTDENGLFRIYNVKKGTYKVQFSLIGATTKVVDVTVSNKDIILNDVILEESSTALDEIVILAQRLNQFGKKKTEYVTRLPLSNIQTPQSYSIVTNELMTEQISTDFGNSLKSVTGGNYIEANTGAVSFYARGFRADARIRNGMKFHNRARTPIESQNIERVEVLKGASAINYGSGFYGGLMNIVTKKPLAFDKNSVGYNFGSFGLHKLTTDINKAFGNNNQYRLRLNGAFYTEDGFQKKGSEIREHYFFAPSFTYQPNENFSLNINSEFIRGKRNLNFKRFTKNVKGKTWSDLKFDYNNSYTNKELAGTFDRSIIQASVDYKFTENWASKTSFSHSNFSFVAPYLMTTIKDSSLERNIMLFDPEEGGSLNIRQDFTANYNFKNIQLNTLIGASYYKGKWDFSRKVIWSSPIDKIDLTNPNAKIKKLTVNDLNSKNPRSATQVFKDENLAGYINNSLTFYNKVTLLTGIRYDKFKNDPTEFNGKKGKDGYEQDKLSYNIGVSVYPFGKNLAVFGNYMNGFKNEGPGLNKENKFVNFEPVESKQWEAGLKLNLFQGKLKSTLSYYNINIDNYILFKRKGKMRYKEQNGKILSKGLEFDVIANPFKGFNIVIGYTYNDAKNLNTTNPKLKDKRLEFTPEQTANAWASYKITKGKIKGLGLGIGGNYVSEIYDNNANTFGAKSYSTIDGTIFYEQKNYRIGLKANNLTNLKYYNAYGIAQKPSNFVIGLNYTF